MIGAGPARLGLPRRAGLWAAGAAACFVLAAPAAAIDVLAMGDSMTAGIGDPSGRGYPQKLQRKLNQRGESSTVRKFGIPGETTLEAVSRVDSVLATGGDVLLFMEGTNDINLIDQGLLSFETVFDSISTVVSKAKQAGVEPVLATTVPRSTKAQRDRQNILTRFLAGEIRELAHKRSVRLADPFEIFDPALHPNFVSEYYDIDPSDPVGHLDEVGYDKLADHFADVLTETDLLPPVLGNFDPGPIVTEISPNETIRIPVYEPEGSSGIAFAETQLKINGRVVADGDSSSGGQRRIELEHQGQKALGCQAVLLVVTEDRADPPNRSERILANYRIQGRRIIDGDVDFDCRVDGFDLISFALRFGAKSNSERYNILFDFNRDGIVDGEDLSVLASNFGKSSI